MKSQSIERTLGERVRWSIVQEASANKAGNVHPGACFADMDYGIFLAAAQAIGDAFQRTFDHSLGSTVLECTRAMLEATGVNTSLGTILLVAPLSKCDSLGNLDRVVRLLEATTAQDCADVYAAIAMCKPGGLGTSRQMDVLGTPPSSLLDAMRLAASWDDVALQYANGFCEVGEYARRLISSPLRSLPLPDAIRSLQLEILSERVDSLIVRKCGLAAGMDVQRRARLVQQSGPYGSALFERAWQQLDSYLRSEGHRRNPGTTADMIAAALYSACESWI